MDTSQIIIGILTAAFLIFLKNANTTAQRQKIAAVRLSSYLTYWQNIVIDNDWFSVFYLGIQWNKEQKEIVKNGGSGKDLVELEEKFKKITTDLKETIETDSPDINIDKEVIIKAIQKIPTELLDNIISISTRSQQNLIEGKTFISDEDIGHMHTFIAHTSIELKMQLISLMSSSVLLIIRASKDGDKLLMQDYATEIAEITWQAMLVSKNINTLSNEIKHYTSSSILQLTLSNVGIKL